MLVMFDDSFDFLLDHEMFLYNFRPEEANNVTVFHVRQVSENAIKLIQALQHRKEKTKAGQIEILVGILSEKAG